MKLAAGTSVTELFGTVAPPPGMSGFTDPATGLGNLFSGLVQMILIIAGLLLLLYLLWGAVEWIISGGDKEKLAKAQQKIQNAIVGMFLVIGSFVIFAVITGDILGNKIIERTDRGWKFVIPTIGP